MEKKIYIYILNHLRKIYFHFPLSACEKHLVSKYFRPARLRKLKFDIQFLGQETSLINFSSGCIHFTRAMHLFRKLDSHLYCVISWNCIGRGIFYNNIWRVCFCYIEPFVRELSPPLYPLFMVLFSKCDISRSFEIVQKPA